MKTKEVRDVLCISLQRAQDGELSSEEARSIIGLANQISQSLAVEVKVISMRLRMGEKVQQFGELNVAE
jgi:hypothetical protein